MCPPTAGTTSACLRRQMPLDTNPPIQFWFTVTVWPATVTVPVRDPPMFGVITNSVLPLPVPERPLVTVIQVTFVVTVQVQPAPTVTVALRVPPGGPTLKEVGLTW